jgi:hypothetical protein
MADSKKKDDPTVKSSQAGGSYPEGTHPAVPVSEGDHSADQLEYREMKGKPDPSTIAQEQVVPDGWPGSGA